MREHRAPTFAVQVVAAMLFMLVANAIAQGNPDQEYKEAIEAARKLLKQDVPEPPVPPDINLKCAEGTAADRLGGVYIQQLIQPEGDICQRLLGAAKQLRLASSANEEKANDALITAGLLYERNVRKADKLIRRYKPKPEKFTAVARASLHVLKESQLLGAASRYNVGDFAPPLSSWAESIADRYLRELRQNHDYRAISAIFALQKTAQMLGGAKIDVGQFLSEVAANLRFKVEFDVSCWVSTGSQRVTLKGSAELAPDQTIQNFTCEGKGEYVSYTKGGKGSAKIEVPNKYSVSMRLLEFKPCDGTAKLAVDKIGSDQETWFVPELGERFTAPGAEFDLFVNTLVDQLFQEYRAKGGFIFSMPISNLQAEMCNGNFTQTGTITTSDGSASASITYNVTITHTPK